MIDRIVIFYGSKKDFETLISKEVYKDQFTIPFMELIQHYNARLRPNESGVPESALYEKFVWTIALLELMIMAQF